MTKPKRLPNSHKKYYVLSCKRPESEIIKNNIHLYMYNMSSIMSEPITRYFRNFLEIIFKVQILILII